MTTLLLPSHDPLPKSALGKAETVTGGFEGRLVVTGTVLEIGVCVVMGTVEDTGTV